MSRVWQKLAYGPAIDEQRAAVQTAVNTSSAAATLQAKEEEAPPVDHNEYTHMAPLPGTQHDISIPNPAPAVTEEDDYFGGGFDDEDEDYY